MNDVSHVIEVRTVGENGEVSKKDPFDPLDINFNSPVQPNTPKSVLKSAALTSIIQNTAMNLIDNGIRNIGRITGDSVLQDKLNGAVTITGYLGQIAVNPIAGGISTATDMGLKIYNYSINRMMKQRDVDMLRERIGYIISSGGR